MRCPHCGSTDVCERTLKSSQSDKDMICLDCSKTWKSGGRKPKQPTQMKAPAKKGSK